MSLDVVFEDVCVTTGSQEILHNVFGAVLPGQIMAIMGPSGAGKTTLLNCLSGRGNISSGAVTLNGQTLNKQLRRQICYVLQQDVFFPNLTLLETLKFTTMLRLPEEMPYAEKMKKLESIIDELDLRKCQNTPMGGMWMPGLSGGEMKRASIACELITDPTVILLDEPTSGLDYKTAFSLIHTLKNYAEHHKKTVISTLHQPSSQMFLVFDLLLLMCDGHSVYYGPPADVPKFFAVAGFPMAPHYNPADFILETIKKSEQVRKQIIQTSYDTRKVTSYSEGEGQETEVRKWNRLPGRQSNDRSNILGSDDVHVKLMEGNVQMTGISDQKWPTGFLTQYKYLTVRAFNQAKIRLVDKFKLFETGFLCVLLSLIWFQLPRTEDTLRDRMGLIFYISMHWGFTPLFDAVTTFPMEHGVIYKERSSGWYRLSAYYLAKMTSELPIILVQPLVFLVVVYWVTGLNNVSSFFATIGTVFIHSIVGQSIGLCIGILAMDMRRGISLATIIIMFIMLIGGFYTRNLPFFLDWAKYLAFLYYTFHCLMILEFIGGKPVLCSEITSSTQSHFASCRPGIVLPGDVNVSLSNSTTFSSLNLTSTVFLESPSNGTVFPGYSVQTEVSSSIPSDEILNFYGIDKPFWQYFIPLFAFLIFFRILGYFLLRFYQKPK